MPAGRTFRFEASRGPVAASPVSEPRDPVADLRRIAFLLERAHESTYRVRAFRTAAAALRGKDRRRAGRGCASGELAAARRRGGHRAVRGRVAGGEEPVYLAGWRRPRAACSPTPRPELRAALRGDCHSHTDASDGGSPLAEMVETAVELGHEYLVVTDHSPRLTVANGLSAERLRAQLEQVGDLNATLGEHRVPGAHRHRGRHPRRRRRSTRTPTCSTSSTSSSRACTRSCACRATEMTERMLTAVANPHVDVLGHCTGRMVTGKRKRPESEFDAARCSTPAPSTASPWRSTRARSAWTRRSGCCASPSRPAATSRSTPTRTRPGQLDWLDRGCARAAACGVPPERVLNTWPAERLLARDG